VTKKSVIGLLLVSVFIFLAEAIGQYDVAYEPTEKEVVDLMLKMANVTEDDMVYDLGCGDGRIVITAAKEFGANGVGIDINPVRISESNENAKRERVTDKVRFIEQNLFEADISEANVLMLFLLPSVNLRLRPKLFRELNPGTRIVSHEHYMREWLPDQTSEVYAAGYNHKVYFWILPANVSGTWEWIAPVNTDKRRYILNLEQKFQEVNGNLTAGGSNIPLMDITIKGNRLQFTIEEEIGNQKVTQIFDGLVNRNLIEGTVVSKSKTTSSESNWKAKRDPSTIIPLDDSDSDSY